MSKYEHLRKTLERLNDNIKQNNLDASQQNFKGVKGSIINKIYNLINNVVSPLRKAQMDAVEINQEILHIMEDLNLKHKDLAHKCEDLVLMYEDLVLKHEDLILKHGDLLIRLAGDDETTNSLIVAVKKLEIGIEKIAERMSGDDITTNSLIEAIRKLENSEEVFQTEKLQMKQRVSDFMSSSLKEISIANSRLRRVERYLKSKDIVIKEPTYLTAPSEEIDMDYYAFEERYRGSEKEIDKRSNHYIRYFINKNNVLDIGCGRGEFLERLIENNISAKGIDINDDMILLCRDKGLPVEKADALDYLINLDDNSLGGIILLQVVEHLSPNQMIQLIRLGFQKLQHGAYFIAETINPKSLIVFTESFFLDPSHIRMIHPYTIHFLMESEGFNDVQLNYLSEVEDLKIPKLEIMNIDNNNLDAFNESVMHLNDIIYGHRDYAVIGRK